MRPSRIERRAGSRRAVVLTGLVAGLLLRPLPGWGAPDPSPELFLRRIYDHYTGRSGTAGLALDNESIVRQLFDPPLAGLILDDQMKSSRRDEPPALDGDPFVDAQDWVIRHLTIVVTSVEARQATASVRFTNLEKPREIRFSLIRLGGGWRIHEISYPQVTLLQILTTADEAARCERSGAGQALGQAARGLQQQMPTHRQEIRREPRP